MFVCVMIKIRHALCQCLQRVEAYISTTENAEIESLTQASPAHSRFLTNADRSRPSSACKTTSDWSRPSSGCKTSSDWSRPGSGQFSSVVSHQVTDVTDAVVTRNEVGGIASIYSSSTNSFLHTTCLGMHAVVASVDISTLIIVDHRTWKPSSQHQIIAILNIYPKLIQFTADSRQMRTDPGQVPVVLATLRGPDQARSATAPRMGLFQLLSLTKWQISLTNQERFLWYSMRSDI